MQDKSEIIKEKIAYLKDRFKNCDLCPRDCHVNRLEGERGYCEASSDMVVYTAFLHRGEEPAISAESGSGTIFFSGCNLRCIYCQNYRFSHSLEGSVMSCDELAGLMLKLQDQKAHNINLVTPTHFLPKVLESLQRAISRGLNIPIVYNSSGYEKKETIELLSGIVDIYLPDMKYSTGIIAATCSNAANYSIYNRAAIEEMYRQQPVNLFDASILKKGLVIRHLVIPGHISETIEILSWIKQNIPNCLTSIMFQYQPYFKANLYPKINRTVSLNEYEQIKETVGQLNLEGWIQDLQQNESLAGVYFKPKSGLL